MRTTAMTIVFLVLLAGSGPAAAAGARDLPVDYVTYGFHPALAADDQGNLHLSFYDGDYLQYGMWDGTSWSFEYVDNTHVHTGQYSSIRIDSQGGPHIVYSDFAGEDRLMYAYKTGGTWPLTMIKQASLLHQTSLGVTESDELWVSYGIFPYYNNSYRELQYAYFDGSTWVTGLIDNQSHSGSMNSLAIEPTTGYPRVSYSVTIGETGDRIKYAEWDGAMWNTETIESGVFDIAQYNSTQVDGNGNAHVVYVDKFKNLRYAVREGGGWQIQTVDQNALPGVPVKLRLDPADHPHIVYVTGYYGQPSDLNLMHAAYYTEWEFTACVEHSETIETWQSLDFELDPALNGHIVFTYTGDNGRGLYHIVVPAPALLGDLNCDGEVNFGDINPFVLALSDPDTYAAMFPDCDIMLADINSDGEVDFGDINPFVALLTGGG